MLCADYDAVTPRVRLTFAPNLGVDPVVTCFDMDPLSLDGQIQRASIAITGEALRCTPCDAAQSIGFSDVFQLETIQGKNWWHGYVKVDFLDPWDGVNAESYMAIDFIELAVNRNCGSVIPTQVGIQKTGADLRDALDPRVREDDAFIGFWTPYPSFPRKWESRRLERTCGMHWIPAFARMT